MEQTYIPDMADDVVDQLGTRIRPIVRFEGAAHYIQPVDLRRTAFTWDPKAAETAENLEPVRDIRTYHTYGYYGFFKPSIAEVLKQIPEDLREQVAAFEIISRPESADDLDAESEALNAGFHVATTRLYRSATT